MFLFHLPKEKKERLIKQWIECIETQEPAWTENRHQSLDTVEYILKEWTVARNTGLEQWNSWKMNVADIYKE